MTDPNLVRLRALVAAGLAELEARRQEVNDLNVFPVADGDTGDNMALTLRAVLEELDRLAESDQSLDEIGRDQIVESVGRAALLGARGNSGVILSQLLIRGATTEELIARPGESSALRCSRPAWLARPIGPTAPCANPPRARCSRSPARCRADSPARSPTSTTLACSPALRRRSRTG